MTSSRRTTITDVALAAGVAKSTVSMVLNRHGRISDETRRHVEQVMRDMQYVPRRNAARPSHHIAIVYAHGMLFCSELIRYCREWIAGIRQTMGRLTPADISIFCGKRDIGQDTLFKASLEDGEFEGVILMGVFQDSGYVEAIRQQGIPMVILNARPDATEFSSVCVHYEEAARLAINRLAELGHQRIGVFFSRRDLYPWNSVRRCVHEQLASHGLSLALDLTATNLTFDDLPQFESMARQIVASGVTAVFSGDPPIYRLGEALHRMGVRIPEDVSLIGIDNLGLKIGQSKRLASIGYDTLEMGRLAAQLISSHCQSPDSVCNHMVTVPVHLYAGQTLAPAPASLPDRPRKSPAMAGASRKTF